MRTETEILLQPYDSNQGNSILHRLIAEFGSDTWTHFRGAIHFAKQSGNYTELLDAMGAFLDRGAHISLTFGADVFGASSFATEHEAILQLLRSFESKPTFRMHLYHERFRTFHPKLYLFSRESERALLILGSSNWSEGGFFNNVEANVVVHLDLHDSEHLECFDRIVERFESSWQEPS
jgi:phosphatidylserine/phosphatidylglycerophosphate/cardiolipin synthase-like enzyme